MQFKHPEILYFLFLLLLPVLVHLFQLRRFKKEYFTNVRFLKELSVQTRKSSKIKKWLLLAIRLLLLTSLIIAFAQPFFNSNVSKNATNEMYLVLDNSFSMQAKGQKGALLKRAVEDLLEHIPETQNFSLLTNSETFWNTDVKSIRKELQNIRYSPIAFQLESAMAKIKAHKSPYNKDVIVISDCIGVTSKQLKSVDKNFRTLFVIPTAEQKYNVAVDSVYIKQVLDNFYEISVKLSAYGSANKEISVALYNKEKLFAKTVVAIESATKTINFTIPKDDFNGSVTITDGSLDYDNTLYFSISKPEKIAVLSIGEQEKSDFLNRIYTADEFNYVNFEIANLDYNLLEKQDAIVLNELNEIPQALQTTLKSFVEKGGNLVVIPSKEITVSNVSSFLTNFGKVAINPLENKEKLVTKIAFNNPVYRAVFEKKVTNFQYPSTKSSFVISNTNTAILSYEDQGIFLTAIPCPMSSVYIFAAALNTSNSNFQNSPLIVPTFYNMAQNASKTGVSNLIIGEKNVILVAVKLSKEEILTLKSKDESTTPTQQILNNKVKITCAFLPEQAGNYGIYKQAELLQNVSFNYNRTESNLAFANENRLSNYTVLESVSSVFDTLQKDQTNAELWKWFVILAFLLLVTELIIQKFVK